MTKSSEKDEHQKHIKTFVITRVLLLLFMVVLIVGLKVITQF
ncbi:MAG: hypothetical protein NWS46_02015 [Cyclobacteriaceae bacterium]|nr:hypothetical protein [Cyclobacteriaceae bacterium]